MNEKLENGTRVSYPYTTTARKIGTVVDRKVLTNGLGQTRTRLRVLWSHVERLDGTFIHKDGKRTWVKSDALRVVPTDVTPVQIAADEKDIQEQFAAGALFVVSDPSAH